MSQPHILLLAAMKQELAPLRAQLARSHLRLAVTGIGEHRAAEAVRRLAASDGDLDLIVSTGCCGGLVPCATAGHIVIPQQVLRLEGEQVTPVPPPDARWAGLARAACQQLGLEHSSGSLVTVRRGLATPEGKRACHDATGAVAVDMETAAIGEAAARLGLPFLSIRVVLDTVEERLPDALFLRLRQISGGLARCLRAVLVTPSEESG